MSEHSKQTEQQKNADSATSNSSNSGNSGNAGDIHSALMGKTNFDKFLNQLKFHEGVKCSAYLDTANPPILTIGVGHNCKVKHVPGVSNVGDTISMELVDTLLKQDICSMEQDLLKGCPWIMRLCEERRAVLSNMAFNLGVPGLMKFKNTLKAVQEERYSDAALGMASSQWYRQVKGRAVELVEQMKTGMWKV